MSPVAVHLTEEAGMIWVLKVLFMMLNGLNGMRIQQKPAQLLLLFKSTVKCKDKIEADEALSQDELKALALNSEKVKELTQGKTIVKTIVVPKKLVNIVVK